MACLIFLFFVSMWYPFQLKLKAYFCLLVKEALFIFKVASVRPKYQPRMGTLYLREVWLVCFSYRVETISVNYVGVSALQQCDKANVLLRASAINKPRKKNRFVVILLKTDEKKNRFVVILLKTDEKKNAKRIVLAAA